MKYFLFITAFCSSILMLTACNDHEEDIPVSSLPQAVINNVQNALPGIDISEAENKTPDEKDPLKIIYELEGKLLNGDEYEIKITGDGRIIKIELED